MDFMTLLRKLGILRYGSKKAVYHNAKEMPAELFMDDVTNAEKDLLHKEDLKFLRRKKKKK